MERKRIIASAVIVFLLIPKALWSQTRVWNRVLSGPALLTMSEFTMWH